MANFIDDLADALGFGNNKQTDAAQRTLDEMLARANSTSAQNRGLIRDYYDQMNGTFSEGAGKYNEAVASLADAIAHQGDYDKTVDDFLDPAREQRVQAAMSAINNSAAAGGNRFSSNYLDKVAAKQQALASEEWRSAYDRLMQDRQQQLQQAQTGVQNLGTMASIYGNDRNSLMQALSDYTSNMANQNNADLQMATDVMGQKANLDANRKGGLAAIIDGIAPMVKAAAPFFGG
jgi:hypothetical protein